MTSLRVLSSNIDAMDIVESSCSSSPGTQPSHIRRPLLPHQLSSLQRMRKIEESIYTGLSCGNEHIFSSYGILGERAGTGKTLTMLSHISQMVSFATPPQPYSRLHPSSTPSFFSLGTCRQERHLPSLLVVPHSLFHHWQSEIEQTSLSCTYLRSQKDIDSDECIVKMINNHITMISNTLFPFLSAKLHQGCLWERIIYDEADIVRIPSSCIPLHTKITWLITSRYRNITHANQQIHSHVIKQLPREYIDSLSNSMKEYIASYVTLHPLLTIYKTVADGFFKSILKNTHPLRGAYVVKTEESRLQESLGLAQPICTTILCKPLRPRTMELLDHGHVEDAVRSIRPRIMKLDDLMKISDMNTKSRLQENTTCGICYDTAKDIVPCITPCCMNLFCGRCIVTWFHIYEKCPMCQAHIDPTSLIMIDCGNPPPSGETKYEKLVSLLQNKGDGQYIIFSRNAVEVYTYICNAFPHMHREIDILSGNKTTVSHILSEFAQKKLRILCFSGEHMSVDLHTATHLLIMDSLRGEEDYILGRAQRLGRKTPLQKIQFSEWSIRA